MNINRRRRKKLHTALGPQFFLNCHSLPKVGVNIMITQIWKLLLSGLMSFMRSQYTMNSTSQTLKKSCCLLWWVEKHQNPLKNLSSTKKNKWEGALIYLQWPRTVFIIAQKNYHSLGFLLLWQVFDYDILCITKFFYSHSWTPMHKLNLSWDSLKDIKKN